MKNVTTSSVLVASMLVVSMAGAAKITGKVTGAGGTGVASARVTLVAAASFKEVRSDPTGAFVVDAVAAGSYTLGVSAPGLEYKESALTVGAADVTAPAISLGPETNVGKWDDIVDPGERLGGTNSGVLLPDGRLLYCHNTIDPVIVDPAAGTVVRAASSGKIQGCHAVTLMNDGRLIYVGGTDREVYGPGIRTVKTFDPVAGLWQSQPDLTDYRWYPTMVPLPNGELLTLGGGGLDNPVRVSTSETFDPKTMKWTKSGDLLIGNEVSPIVSLYTGEVLMTHRPPQLYDPAKRTWRVAKDFVQGNRMKDGDHADHELILLADGRVVAIGFKTFTAGAFGNIVEIYDPPTNTWKLGKPMAPVRSRPSSLMLPTGNILVMGGFKEETTDATPVNAWGQVALTDLYDPIADSWRRLGNLDLAREYHATPILVPDGRVFIVGGEGKPGEEPARSEVEAFSPPYLFRGPRPVMKDLSRTKLRRGETVTFTIENTAAPTRVVMIGTIASTHFQDSGNGRFLDLSFTQVGNTIRAAVPVDPNRSVFGFYTLFAMVDDIPSKGMVVSVVEGTPDPPPPDAGPLPDAGSFDSAATDGGVIADSSVSTDSSSATDGATTDGATDSSSSCGCLVAGDRGETSFVVVSAASIAAALIRRRERRRHAGR
jgi:hypothetical protein